MALLEREPFLQDLGGFLQEAASGQGRLLFLGGEAGAGKTVLVRSFCRSVQTGARVLTGGCDPLSTPRPLEPLLDIAAALGSDLLRLLEQPDGRGHAFRAFLGMLKRPARPTVVVFEDVHWADEATLDLLRFLGRRVGDTRALLIATYRDDEVGAAHPLRAVLGDLATSPAVARLALPPLSPGAVAVLAGGTGLDAAELYRKTGGNPFFVTEVLASDGAGVPATVRDAVLARAARLPPEGRELLGVAAVLGARVEPWLLEAVYGPGDGALESCLASGILQRHGALFMFRHELAREALLADLLPGRTLALHQRTLTALRQAAVDDPARLAHHAEAAGDGQAVLEYAPEAARRAVALSAHREATSQYARALRFADALPLRERAELLDVYADECGRTDDQAEAIRARESALAAWRGLGDKLQEGHNLIKLSNEYIRVGRNAEGDAASAEARRLMDASSVAAERARAYLNEGYVRMLNRDNAEAVAWCEKAIALAGETSDVNFRIGAYNNLGTAQLMAGDDEAGAANLLRSAELARTAGLELHVAGAYSMLGTGSGELYKFARAEHYLKEAIAITTRHDLDFLRYYATSWLALVYLYQGRCAEATETAWEVLRRPSVSLISRIMALIALGRLRARRGDPEVWTALDEALELAARTGTLQRLAPVRAARAEAAWLSGDREKTLEEARAVYELALRHKHPWFVGELAYWRWKAGEASEPPPEAAEPFAMQMAGNWAGAAKEWQHLGCPYEAARALAESDDETVLRQAHEAFESLGGRPAATEVARRMRDLGLKGLPRGPRPSTLANPAKLTRRELEVLALLVEGRSNTDIAAQLFRSPKTIDHHVSAILAKLVVSNRTEAVRKAVQLGMLDQNREPQTPN